MTFQREIAWKHLDSLHKSSISHQFANYALGIDYDLLPEDVIHHAKRCLLDTLGCAIGAFNAPGRPICEDVVRDLGGPEEATIFGSGMRTTASNATLVNSFLVRYLDFNDIGGGGHNSDSIPGILAICERQGSTGQDLIRAIVTSYELGARYGGAVKHWLDWFSDSRASVTMPAVLGRLMGLDADQIANAIGTCASGNMVLHIMDTSLEDKTMRKNLRFGWGACAAITSCILAKHGFTGPLRVIEGEKGQNQVMYDGEMDIERMLDFRGWRIRDTRFKYHCSQMNMQGHIGAAIEVAKENDLKPEDVASIRLRIYPSDLARATVPIMYPRNPETADHSIFFLIATAIKEREVGAESVDPERLTDPVILELSEKITVESDPKLPPKSVEAHFELTTTNGKTFTRHVVRPHGFADDPLTDRELEGKLTKMASRYMPDKQIKALIDTVWRAESLGSIAELTKLMVLKPS